MPTDYQYDLTPQNIGGKEVVFVKGLGQVIPQYSQMRSFDDVADQLFPQLRAAELMSYGEGSKWDDRKYRLNAPQIGDQVVVPIGLTYFGANVADIARGDSKNKELQAQGEHDYDDHWAYFARALGAAFVFVTKDGSAFVGERTGKLYSGCLNAAAGYVNFSGEPSLGMFQDQAKRELKEEFGRTVEVVESRFVGIASHPLKGDADVVWVGRIDAPAEYFVSGRWRVDRRDQEHAPNLVRISTAAERDMLLAEGRLGPKKFPGIMYSTRLGLEALTEKDFMIS